MTKQEFIGGISWRAESQYLDQLAGNDVEVDEVEIDDSNDGGYDDIAQA